MFASWPIEPMGRMPAAREAASPCIAQTYMLSAEGWAPTVISVRPGYYVHHDATLERELPPEVRVVRTGSLEPRPSTVRWFSRLENFKPRNHSARGI